MTNAAVQTVLFLAAVLSLFVFQAYLNFRRHREVVDAIDGSFLMKRRAAAKKTYSPKTYAPAR